MKKIMVAVIVALAATFTPTAQACDWLWSVFAKPCNGAVKAYKTGDDELMLSGYSYHVRSSYTPEKLAEFNEHSWGVGYGKTAEDADGDQHTLFWLTFRDSHRNNQWHLGYTYSTFWGQRDGAQFGLGYVAMLAQRPDIFGGVPFPAIVPLVTVKWKNTSISATWIPKISESINNGNVIYMFARHTFK